MTPEPSAQPLKLDSLQRDILKSELEVFIHASAASSSGDAYRALLAAVEAGEVGPELAARFGAVLELLLANGRVRRLFGPGAELSLLELFRKTPHGLEMAAALDALNQALAKLKGERLREISVAMRAPGVYALRLGAGGCEIVVRLEESAACVESLEVGSE